MGNRAATPTILVVDDSPTVRMHLCDLLEEHGFQVVSATNGLEGLEEARKAPVDLMIVDVNMPVMTGLEMIAGVRRLIAHRNTPIFVATTEASDEAVRVGMAAGATAWIVKPVEAEILVPAILRALRAA
jgi:two-component system chemotaxis response regulator CheY